MGTKAKRRQVSVSILEAVIEPLKCVVEENLIRVKENEQETEKQKSRTNGSRKPLPL